MSNTSFEHKIEAVVATLTIKPTFTGGSWYKANILLEKLTLPAVIYITPISGDLLRAGNIFLDAPNCLLAFVDKIDMDAPWEQSVECLDRMKKLAEEFIFRAEQSYFKHIDNPHYSVLEDRTDVNLCGIVLEAKIEERQGTNTCTFS